MGRGHGESDCFDTGELGACVSARVALRRVATRRSIGSAVPNGACKLSDQTDELSLVAFSFLLFGFG